jgi:hypothetical protein
MMNDEYRAGPLLQSTFIILYSLFIFSLNFAAKLKKALA